MGLAVVPVRADDATVADLVRSEGTAASPWPARLLIGHDPRDTADAAHTLCQMYGAHPSAIDSAIHRSEERALSDWLEDAAQSFEQERAHLAAVVAAAGPLPSTPGQAHSEAVIAAQRHALEVLARSDRAGCAIGAAVALALDWRAVRPIVDRIAIRAGIVPPASTLPVAEPALPDDPRLQRARLFGARQLLAQQRGLWDLLESRSAARQR